MGFGSLARIVIWAIGQKVLAELEPELGLGEVVGLTLPRFMEVHFSKAQLTRRYACAGAPLRRLKLPSGGRVRLRQGDSGTITAVREHQHLLYYSINGSEVCENEVEALVDQSDPMSEILAGRWDNPRAFQLRELAWQVRRLSRDSHWRGLAGARVALLPHQLYVAQQVARRPYPRVLLADEVGLGKTIEAGLIFSYLRASERAERVLILAPEALKYQWLAEMYRRFQELFTVLDEERASLEESAGDSLFETNRRLICSRDFFLDYPDWLEEALEYQWDLLIVDEAHHLQWSEEEPGAAWEMVKVLSEKARGILLLTATPERRGLDTEFGLLNLVDASRFTDFAGFEEEMAQRKKVARFATEILSQNRQPEFVEKAKDFFAKDPAIVAVLDRYAKGASPDTVLRPLVDRHGTGRVFMRNRRARIQGFPERRYFPHALTMPEALEKRLAGFTPKALDDEEILRIASGQWRSPREPSAELWFLARARWLAGLLQALKGKKVLLICASAKRAIQLQEWLRKEGFSRTAVFHEGMDIVERDRQAAWFAEATGAQVLLCSEIGSEGRNFQFANQLVIFDLPLHPDTLEQRIGRLDRIGQKLPVEIHVPYFKDTPEEVLARWYAEGLESFVRPWNGGVVESLLPLLVDTGRHYFAKDKDWDKREQNLQALIKKTKTSVKRLLELQKESTDVLIDLNSYDEEKGRNIAARIEALDKGGLLEQFLESAFDYFGVESEPLDEAGTVKMTAHSLTFVESFPGLTGHEEKLVTFKRDHALVREDLEFLSWDHPIVQGTLGLVLEGKVGKASAAVFRGPRAKEPALIELMFVIQVTAPSSLELEEDLQSESFKLCYTLEGKAVEMPALAEEEIEAANPVMLEPWLEKMREALPKILEQANRKADSLTRETARKASERRQLRLGEEVQRIKELAKINPLISEKEIKEYEAQLESGKAALKQAAARLDGIRLLIPA